MMSYTVQDSGARKEAPTGSVRDIQSNKGRPSLMPILPLRRLSQHFENGALKYGDRNWEKGQPLSWFYDSAQRHLWKILENAQDEDHYAAAMWNVACMMQTIEWIKEGVLPRELDDLHLVDDIMPDSIDSIEMHKGQLVTYWINNEQVTFRK